MTTASAGRPSNSLHYAVGEIGGKLDQLILTLLPRLTSLEEADTAIQLRLSTVEAFVYRLTGGAALLVFIVSGWEVTRYVLKL